jgi:endo-1,3(4)-beta-glucanase
MRTPSRCGGVSSGTGTWRPGKSLAPRSGRRRCTDGTSGTLMLAVQARSFMDYYLYASDNGVQPARFIGNRAAGILFENKVDHTTYFGSRLEYIQGIHMLPLLPHTPLIRAPRFVAEEWHALFASGRAHEAEGGWRGILFGNYATIDPRGAFEFFSAPGFDPAWLDGGASLTWYLCYAAGEFSSGADEGEKMLMCRF